LELHKCESFDVEKNVCRIENRELSHQLDSARLDMKNLEEQFIFIEEKNSKDLAEFEENKVRDSSSNSQAQQIPGSF
jgi:hypothetical protein